MSDAAITYKTELDNSDLIKDLKKAKQDIERLQKDIDAGAEKRLPLAKSVEDLSAQLETAKAKLAGLRQTQVFSDDDLPKKAKELSDLEKGAVKLKNAISSAELAKAPAVSKAAQIQADLDVAKERQRASESSGEILSPSAVKRNEQEITALQKKWDAAMDKVDAYDEKIKAATASLERNRAAAAELSAGVATGQEITAAAAKAASLEAKLRGATDRLNQADVAAQHLQTHLDGSKMKAAQLEKRLAQAQSMQPLNDAMKGTETRMLRFGKRMIGLMRRVFVFTVILQAFRKIKAWFTDILMRNQEAQAAVARLKGALLTLAQPMVDAVIPAFIKFINILADAVAILANVSSLLFGKRVQDSAKAAKALDKEGKAIAGVGKAAGKAAGKLAAFDEINTLGADDSGAGGVGASSSAPDFSAFDNGELAGKLDALTAILGGALFAVGAILAFSGANIPLGIGMMALGAAILYKEAELNWENLPNQVRDAISGVLVLAGIVALVVGLCLALSGANIPLGIGLIAIGAASLAAAAGLNWDAMGNTIYEKLANIFVIVGPVIAAVGLFLISAGNFPLGLAMIIAGAAAFGVTLVALNWDALGSTTKERLGNILMIIAPFLAVVGLLLMLSGVAFPLGLGLLIAGSAAFMVGSIAAQWDNVPNTTRDKLALILRVVGGFLFVVGLLLCLTGVAFPIGLGLMIAGASAVGISAVMANWDFIVNKVADIWAGVKRYWNTNIAKYFTLSYWKEKGKTIVSGIVSGIKSGASKITGAITGAVSSGWDWITGKSRSASPSMITPASITPDDVPALARGAVIPPNREFMAVLGDQRRGNNIEAPEDLIRKIVREESRSNYSDQLLREILDAIREGKVLMVGKKQLGEVVSEVLANQARARGAATIPVV